MNIQVSKRAGREVYSYVFSGHVGYMREAIRRTPGTYVGRKGWGNGKAGINTTMTIGFDHPDEALFESLMINYRDVCAEQAAARRAKKEGQGLPAFVPVARLRPSSLTIISNEQV